MMAILLLLATALRLPTVGLNSLWFDEAVSYLTAVLPLPQILNNTIQDPHPPLYYLVLRFWLQLVPDSDTAVRLLDLIWSLLLIPSIYLLAVTLLKDRRLGLLAAGLIAISPFHILYSHELRMYTLLMLLTTLSAWTYIRARERGTLTWWGLFTLWALLALYTHLFTIFFLAAVALHAIIYRQHGHALRNTILTVLTLAILFVPWLLVLSSELESGMGSMRPLLADRETTADPLRWLTVPAFLLFGQAMNFGYVAVVLFVTLAVLLILPLELRRAGREGNTDALALPFLIVTAVIGLPVFLYYLRPFFLPERTMAAASPFLVVLLAWGLSRARSPLPLLVPVSALVMVIGSWLYLAGPPTKPPYRDVIKYVAQNRQAGDVVLHTSDGSYLPALRYVGIPNHALLAGDPEPRKPEPVYQALGGRLWSRREAATAGSRLWLIVALEHSIAWQTEQAAYFADGYFLLEQHDFAGIQLLLYDLSSKQTQ